MELLSIINLLANTLPHWVTTLLPILQIIFTCVLVLSAILLILVVFLQEPNTSGLGSISGGGSENSFYTQNKGNSKEGRLKRWTYILASSILIFSILYFICEIIYPAA